MASLHKKSAGMVPRASEFSNAAALEFLRHTFSKICIFLAEGMYDLTSQNCYELLLRQVGLNLLVQRSAYYHRTTGARDIVHRYFITNLLSDIITQFSSSRRLEHELSGSRVSAVDSSVQPSSQNATVEPVNDKELSESRLVGQEAPCVGLLQVRYRGQWGSVCSSLWDSTVGEVVCRQNGCNAYHTTVSIPISQETGPILLDKVHCAGTESSLSECSFSASDQQNCGTGTVVGFFCKVRQLAVLKDGGSPCAGRVEASNFLATRVVCGRMWDMNEARAFCKFLSCGDAVSASGNSQFGAGQASMLNFELHCKGTEEDPWKCELKALAHKNCSAEKEAAGAVCSGEDWQMRLANGETTCDGRVEVYNRGTWGRVTDTQWNFNDADVVCRQLNCGSAIRVYNQSKFGKGTDPSLINNVTCNGSERFLANCNFTQMKELSIDDDVGVVCSDHIQIRLVDGGSRCAGRVELYSNGTWGTVCDDSWDLADAQIVCNQLKCGQALNATISGWFGPGLGPIWLDNVKCGANDSLLWECLPGRWSENDCNHKEDAGVICSEHRALRLQDGANPCQGRVEIFYNGTWGSVCSDSFGIKEADVVCQQLGCGSAQAVDRDVTFGSGSGQIWLDDVSCRSHDTVLWECLSSPWGENNCDHQEDVGVICSELNPGRMHSDDDRKKSNMEPVSEDSELRLAAGSNNCSGRVEIFFSGTWGTVCDDSWDRHDAAVVCRQLNCGEPVWAVGETLLDQANGTIWMDEVQCKGSELFLWDCQLSAMGDHDCDHKGDVNVICSGHQKHRTPFNQERPSIFIIPCIFVVLLIAVSLALAAELQKSFQKANRNRQYHTTGFHDPVYEEIEVQELGTGTGLQSISSLNKLEYYTDSELHEHEDANVEDSLIFDDIEFGRQYDDIQ
ncbi:deleted in malignant brain tumors 1 protein-like [Chiloscyllium plagiosum]|uniref:deleted in malignant brain tumors 1 protein-like n=1 Tax=Chiloscyllium plagiosum TaxID=36176 RepID=UPI001CB877A5|nr:deleted in malignant brain tumors 1 protein-like [Chiloscyllium plagiosum]